MNLLKQYFISISSTLLMLSSLYSQVLSPVPLDILRVEFEGGGSTTYKLVPRPVLKPELPLVVVAPAKAPVAPTKAEIEQNRLWEAKRQVTISWSGTVYDQGVSEVRWWEEGQELIILSSINFNTFGFLTDFETADSVYSFMFFLGEDSLREIKDGNRLSQLALLKSSLSPKSHYLVAQGQLSAGSLQTLNDLHRYYDQHQTKLVKNYAEQQAQQRKQEAWLKANPPQPVDSVVTYFPILSDYHLRKKP